MLIINPNKIASASTSLLQTVLQETLSSHQKIITAVALAALTVLTLSFAYYKGWFGNMAGRVTDAPIGIPLKPIEIPVVSSSQKSDYRKGIRAFSFEMYQKVIEKPVTSNLIISPLSISLALSMLKHGLSTSSQEELERILHLPKDEKELQGCAHQLMNQLKAAGVDVANLVYLNEHYRLNPDYQSVVSQSYQSKVSSGSSAQEINAWVKEVTHGQIQEMVKQDDLDDFFVALLNAIHFNAKWTDSFDTDQTYPADFNTTPADKIKVDMMHDRRKVHYFENDQCQAISLPYQDSDARMLLILPNPGIPVSSLDESLFDEITGHLDVEDVRIELPKFDLTHEIDLIPLLQSVGLSDLFKKPDFTPLVDLTHAPSQMALTRGLSVSKVQQKSALKIDEKETKASTVTYVAVAKGTSEPPVQVQQPKEIHFNRPFLAALVQEKTPILFGIINNPKG